MSEQENQKFNYEDALRNTLMNRTGRGFQRDVEKASMPEKQERLSKEETVELIFDNILKKREDRLPDNNYEDQDLAPHPLTQAQNLGPAGQIGRSYGDILDEILWPDAPVQASDSPKTPSQPLSAPTGTRQPDYKSILKNTLMNRTGQTLPAPIVQPIKPATTINSSPEAEPVQKYEDILDDILGFYDNADSGHGDEGDEPEQSLTQTSYGRQLDAVLWPQAEANPAEDLTKKKT